MSKELSPDLNNFDNWTVDDINKKFSEITTAYKSLEENEIEKRFGEHSCLDILLILLMNHFRPIKQENSKDIVLNEKIIKILLWNYSNPGTELENYEQLEYIGNGLPTNNHKEELFLFALSTALSKQFPETHKLLINNTTSLIGQFFLLFQPLKEDYIDSTDNPSALIIIIYIYIYMPQRKRIDTVVLKKLLIKFFKNPDDHLLKAFFRFFMKYLGRVKNTLQEIAEVLAELNKIELIEIFVNETNLDIYSHAKDLHRHFIKYFEEKNNSLIGELLKLYHARREQSHFLGYLNIVNKPDDDCLHEVTITDFCYPEIYYWYSQDEAIIWERLVLINKHFGLLKTAWFGTITQWNSHLLFGVSEFYILLKGIEAKESFDLTPRLKESILENHGVLLSPNCHLTISDQILSEIIDIISKLVNEK
jgi:hypothetical protein